MADSSGGANTADSYIGSLISLTSKSEIRYEGVLYTVDTENSNIALSNVRSFGTEGRKKDGPQILPSDKVYDFIIFRGTDIKDLVVKSSPAAVPALHQPPSDPAIIHLQSQYTQPASLAPTYVPPSQVGPPTDASLPAGYGGIRSPAFRGSVPPMYQPAAGMGSWGVPPMPGVNGTGIAMPMYWQGYYRPPSGQAQLQPQPLPVPNLTPQHVLQAAGRSYLSPSASLSGVPTGVASSQANMAFANTPPPPMAAMQPYVPAATSEPLTPASFPASSAASMLVAASLSATSVVPPATPPAAPAVTSSIISASAAVSGPSSAVENLASSAYGVSAVITPAAKNPRRSNAPGQAAIALLQDGGGGGGVAGPGPVPMGLSASAHAAATKGVWSNASGQKPLGAPQAQKGAGSLEPSILEQNLLQSAHQISAVASEELQQQISQPLLPLPVTSVQPKIVPQWHGGQRSAVSRQSDRWQGNGSPGHSNNYGRRPRGRAGSGRGIGVSHPTKQFTEDFDFTAMNERFKKDEVWGELGGKGDGGEKVLLPISVDGVDGNPDEEELDGLALSSKSLPDAPKKPMYVKEDFFDSLSCDALDREGGRAERTKYSEQRKIDTETFGTFPLRSRGGRGGRGGMRGGYRGGGGFYNQQYSGGGRGNGYGRARNAPRTTSPK